MGSNPRPDGLRHALLRVLELESGIGDLLGRMPANSRRHAGTLEILDRLGRVAEEHREALQKRWLHLFGDDRLPGAKAPPSGGADPEAPMTAADSAAALFGHLNETVLAYAVLHATAHRLFDGPADGTTAHLAERNLRQYVPIAEALTSSISELTVWELSEGGQECRCECPACGLGVCVCSPHGAVTIATAYRDPDTPVITVASRGVRIRPPRAGSRAREAGLRPGDAIVAVDGRPVPDESGDSIRTLQQAIHAHPSGEAIRFTVASSGGGSAEVILSR